MATTAASGNSGPLGLDDPALLRQILLAIGLRPDGYRRVLGGPRARLGARAEALGLDGEGYLRRLRADPEEQVRAERLATVTRTRFFRDRELWEYLRDAVLPTLVRRRWSRLWCAGCAAGEEAYSLALLLVEAGMGPCQELRIVATELRPDCLERARAAAYPASSLRSLPEELRGRWFRPQGELWVLDRRVRGLVDFAQHDLARDPWPAQIDLALVRNVVFTYWAEDRQQLAMERMPRSLSSHGTLVIGRRERLPAGGESVFARVGNLPVYRLRD